MSRTLRNVQYKDRDTMNHDIDAMIHDIELQEALDELDNPEIEEDEWHLDADGHINLL